jgi:hypothetical protein
MDREENRTVWPLLLGGVLLMLLLAGAGWVFFSGSVGGTASLPHGATARISGAFSCSESSGRTTIEAGGRVFTFTPTDLAVDGVPVARLDPTVTSVQIDSSLWGTSLSLGGRPVALP